jgi:hypothetical protein
MVKVSVEGRNETSVPLRPSQSPTILSGDSGTPSLKVI